VISRFQNCVFLSAKSRIVEIRGQGFARVSPSVPLKSRGKAGNWQGAGVEIVYMPHKRDLLDLKSVLFSELGRREILNVLLEAGPPAERSALAATWLIFFFILS